MQLKCCFGGTGLPEPGEPAAGHGGTGRSSNTNRFLKQTVRTPKASLVGEKSIENTKGYTGFLEKVLKSIQVFDFQPELSWGSLDRLKMMAQGPLRFSTRQAHSENF